MTDFDNKVKNVTSNKSELNELSKKLKAISIKRLAKDLINKFSILDGAKYFPSGISQSYLVFIPAKKYIKYFSGTTKIYSWKSNGMSGESVENITELDSNFAATFVEHHVLPEINFSGHCLVSNNISIRKIVINLYISYTLSPWFNSNTDFTLKICLFGSVKLTKTADPDKYKYSGYGIEFNSRSEFSFIDGTMRRNIIIFGADMSSSVHADNKNNDNLVLGEEPTQT